LFSFFFYLSSTSKGMIALQGCKSSPQSFNCIEFDLFVFQFHSLTFYFFVFFYQIWSLSFWFLFILLLIFFYWILFFDLIPNHFILIFFSFSIWSSFLWLQLLLFWVIFFINYFLFQFHPLLFNFTELSYRIWCLIFFILLLILGPIVDSHHVSGHMLGRITWVTGINRIFYCVGSKNDIILIKKLK
jgi:hypothetical protein